MVKIFNTLKFNHNFFFLIFTAVFFNFRFKFQRLEHIQEKFQFLTLKNLYDEKLNEFFLKVSWEQNFGDWENINVNHAKHSNQNW